jgi:chromosome segregation ATPase
MNRRLQYLNLFGVLGLGLLCVVQWYHDRELNLELNESRKLVQACEKQLADNTNTINGLSADLASFKTSYTTARAEATELQSKLQASDRANTQLTGERDQLKESITNWAAAVKARDERLKESNVRLTELANKLNESISKFNALATNYNSVVDQLNAARAAGAPPPASK